MNDVCERFFRDYRLEGVDVVLYADTFEEMMLKIREDAKEAKKRYGERWVMEYGSTHDNEGGGLKHNVVYVIRKY